MKPRFLLRSVVNVWLTPVPRLLLRQPQVSLISGEGRGLHEAVWCMRERMGAPAATVGSFHSPRKHPRHQSIMCSSAVSWTSLPGLAILQAESAPQNC